MPVHAVKKVAAIGLDSGDWDFIEQMLDEGNLPNLAQIRARSLRCVIDSEALYRGTVIWEVFLTGRDDPDDPRASGVGFDPKRYHVFKIGAGHARPFFSAMPSSQSIAFDVPHLSLAGGGSDVRICTWGAHSRSHPRASNPRGLIEEIDKTFGRHPAFAREHLYAWHLPEVVDRLASDLAAGSRKRVDAAVWLQKRFPDWRLFVTVMSESHSAGESYGHVVEPTHPLMQLKIAERHRARLRDVYIALDDAIGKFASALSPDAMLVIFSLHGTGATHGELPSMALLPELLHRLTIGRKLLKDPDQVEWRRDPRALEPAPDESWEDYMRRRFAEPPALRLRRTLIDKRTQVGERLAWKFRDLRTNSEPPHSFLGWQVASWYRLHWPRMRAFALPSFADGRVRINLRGRERSGMVDAADYEKACAEIEDCVSSCRDPRTGKGVVQRITRPRASDPLAPGGPDADLVIEWSHGIDTLEHSKLGMIGPFPFRRTGEHTPRGFAMFSGPGTREAADLGVHRVVDLPATILALLGQEQPAGSNGRAFLRPADIG